MSAADKGIVTESIQVASSPWLLVLLRVKQFPNEAGQISAEMLPFTGVVLCTFCMCLFEL